MTFWRCVLGKPIQCDLKTCPLVTEQPTLDERQECQTCRLTAHDDLATCCAKSMDPIRDRS